MKNYKIVKRNSSLKELDLSDENHQKVLKTYLAEPCRQESEKEDENLTEIHQHVSGLEKYNQIRN
jgi:hypothetical protein